MRSLLSAGTPRILSLTTRNNCGFDFSSLYRTLLLPLLSPPLFPFWQHSQRLRPLPGKRMQNTNQLGVSKQTQIAREPRIGIPIPARTKKYPDICVCTHVCMCVWVCTSACLDFYLFADAAGLRGSPRRRLLNGYQWKAINATLIYCNLISFPFDHLRVFYIANYVQTRLGRGRHLAAQKVGVTTMVIYSFVYMIYSASDAAQAQKKTCPQLCLPGKYKYMPDI